MIRESDGSWAATKKTAEENGDPQIPQSGADWSTEHGPFLLSVSKTLREIYRYPPNTISRKRTKSAKSIVA
jgi:hypothetical protein